MKAHRKAAEIVLVRHGETLGESSIRLNGATDVALSPLGQRQMQRVGRALMGERFARVLVSPLVRSQESARLAYPDGRGRVVPGFSEIDFGAWETLTWAEVQAADPETYADCMRGETGFRFPAGESRIGFYERVSRAARRELSTEAAGTLCVLHKGVSKIIMATLLELEWGAYRELPCDLGSIHRLRYDGSRWHLTTANDVSHLKEDWLADHPA